MIEFLKFIDRTFVIIAYSLYFLFEKIFKVSPTFCSMGMYIGLLFWCFQTNVENGCGYVTATLMTFCLSMILWGKFPILNAENTLYVQGKLHEFNLPERKSLSNNFAISRLVACVVYYILVWLAALPSSYNLFVCFFIIILAVYFESLVVEEKKVV